MFGKKRFLDPEIEEWHLECWAWLMRHLGGVSALRETALVLPTTAFFERAPAEGHAYAERMFARVKDLMGLNDWPCVLAPRDEDNAWLGGHVMLQPEKSIGGTFQAAGNEVVVTYAPRLIQKPFELITTFAHELAHYLLHTIEEPPPGADVEPMLEELATEMGVAYCGFALMAANAAFVFEQFQDTGSQGWRGGSVGYFSEDSWIFALAVFIALRESGGIEGVCQHLKPHLAKRLSAAMAHIERTPALLAPLRTL